MPAVVNALYKPQPGDIGLCQISGDVGRLIRLGQWLNGDGYTTYEHAFVVTDELGPNGKPMIVEAEPGGAQFNELHYDDVYWCQGISHGLTPADRAAISQAAIEFIGVGYSFLDYFSIAALRLHLPRALLKNYVASVKHVICSQLAASAYYKAGKPIWPGAWTGDDTPGDLYIQDAFLRAKYSM